MTRRLFAALSALAMPLVLLGFGPQAHSHPPGSSQSRLNLESNFGKFPLAFEPNRGQEASPVKFLCRGGGYSLFVTGDEAVFLLKKPAPKFPIHPDKTFSRPKPQAPDILRLKLAQANPDALFEGAQALPGISNYFIGPDPAHWVTRVPQYSRVVLHGVYPGVDVAYYGNQGRLEYDFQVNPGADPRSIHMHIEGADSVQTDGQGNLQLTVKGRKVLFEAPQVYQEDGTGRRPVSGRYSAGGNNDVSFDVKDYDPSRKLVIDPVLDYGTYLGGTGGDRGTGIAVDGLGNTYITGLTSGSFPITPGAIQSVFGSKVYTEMNDVFVSKFDPTGSTLLYSTYLGGLNGVVAELNPTGSALLYSTFLEQAYSSTISWAAYPTGIEVDDCGNIHVTGATSYPSFPLTSGAWDNSFSASGFAGFFLVLNPAQTGSAQLVFSTFMGSSSSTFPYSMAKDPSGNLYVAGETGSGFPSTGGSYQAAYGGPSCCGDGDAFVAKIDVSSLCVSGTATPTPTNSPTSTSTLTPGSTATPSSTPTVSATATPTNSLTYTSTATPSSTPTLSPTAPPTDTATPTPSLTPSSTPTVTTTFTPTDSPTPKGFHPPTATPTPAPIGIGWPYPNPDWGEGPVNIPIQAAAGCSVECKVYTTAFRKIRDFTRPMTADAYHLTWDLDDNWQAPVANGLYYMEVEVTGPVQMSKLFKVLVAR